MSELILQKLLDNGVINDKTYIVMNYVWTKLSYIPWHNDTTYTSAITIYLNEYWDPDWGGIFLYHTETEQKNIKGYIPKFNTAIKNSRKVYHSTTIISMDAETPRVTVQLFKGGE
jgi:Rps23 Pro-64 3,4-dihydroxylase Tpa1-like proline 4-hydroxylase